MVWLNNLGFADPYGSTSKAVDALFAGEAGSRELGGGLRAVRVGDGDERLLSAVIDCLAAGECGTTSTAPDPLLDWVYEPRAASEVYKPLAAAPSAHRLRWFRWLTSYSAYFALARGGLYALVDVSSPGRILAAAVTGPPGTIPYGRMSGGEMGDWCQKAGMEMAIEVLANNMRNRVLGTWQAQAHGGGGGHSRHLEVVIVATAPEYQGRGIGAALLRFLGEVADADGVATHLETAGCVCSDAGMTQRLPALHRGAWAGSGGPNQYRVNSCVRRGGGGGGGGGQFFSRRPPTGG
jgi:GNAT superfamily N-acetyltransferase